MTATDPGTLRYLELESTYAAHNYQPLDVVIERAAGVWVWAVEGRKYLDLLASYGALNQGHNHPRIVRALVEQAQTLALTSRAFRNNRFGPFCEKLAKLSSYEKVLMMNTGAEAVETAIKAARRWGYRVKGIKDGAAEIIVAEGNFLGRTTTIVGFSSEAQYRDGFGPFTPGFKLIPYGSAAALEAAINENTVGFLVEPLQGEGGVVMPPEGFLTRARELCTQHGVALLADEIQTGLGRTGRLFCCDWESVRPDVLIVGKALGGGLYPVSAAIADEVFMDVFHPGDHGSTFGGNPLGAAIGRASLRVTLSEKLPERADELGVWFMQKLREIDSPHVDEIRGKGLMIGVEIKESSGTARPFCEALEEKGVLAKETHHQVIRFAPPLTITQEELEFALEQATDVLSS